MLAMSRNAALAASGWPEPSAWLRLLRYVASTRRTTESPALARAGVCAMVLSSRASASIAVGS